METGVHGENHYGSYAIGNLYTWDCVEYTSSQLNVTSQSLINVSYPFWHLVWKCVELEPSPPKKKEYPTFILLQGHCFKVTAHQSSRTKWKAINTTLSEQNRRMVERGKIKVIACILLWPWQWVNYNYRLIIKISMQILKIAVFSYFLIDTKHTITNNSMKVLFYMG